MIVGIAASQTQSTIKRKGGGPRVVTKEAQHRRDLPQTLHYAHFLPAPSSSVTWRRVLGEVSSCC